MIGINEVDGRSEAWCKAMGLRASRARPSSALRWLDEYNFPPGFDHSFIYYYPPARLHFILTEPYHSVEKAMLSLDALAAKRCGEYSFAIGQLGSGIWYPGACVSLLVARPFSEHLLEQFAAGLPRLPLEIAA